MYTVTTPTPPLVTQVYSRQKETHDTCLIPISSLSNPTVLPVFPPSDPTPSDLNLPIALRKGKHQWTYPISNFVSSNHLSPCSLIVSLDSISIPKTILKALNHLGWCDAMLEEIHSLDENDTWDLVDLLVSKHVVECKWVFTVKVNPNGSIARLEARLVAKGYAHTYSVDYSNTLMWQNSPLFIYSSH